MFSFFFVFVFVFCFCFCLFVCFFLISGHRRIALALKRASFHNVLMLLITKHSNCVFSFVTQAVRIKSSQDVNKERHDSETSSPSFLITVGLQLSTSSYTEKKILFSFRPRPHVYGTFVCFSPFIDISHTEKCPLMLKQ